MAPHAHSSGGVWCPGRRGWGSWLTEHLGSLRSGWLCTWHRKAAPANISDHFNPWYFCAQQFSAAADSGSIYILKTKYPSVDITPETRFSTFSSFSVNVPPFPDFLLMAWATPTTWCKERKGVVSLTEITGINPPKGAYFRISLCALK